MFTVNLHNLSFYAFHGVYDEEKILGNHYEVNVVISFETKEPVITLEQTINYEKVYEIISQRMLVPADLLETLAQEIAHAIYHFENRCQSISVSIEKKDPPIKNMQGSVSVIYKTAF
ncbi:MAG: dihydroneopterin aldolase [Chitinophagaceae bacterium]|nr:dihydroneopterin aldolase [Chitinophagaceae bacterium]MBK9530596.1 dihydroneopterin aldolase [Chitinophagaceae bacterium]